MTRRKDFAARRDGVLSACANARNVWPTADHDTKQVRESLLAFISEVENLARTGKLKAANLPTIARRHLFEPLRTFFSVEVSHSDIEALIRDRPNDDPSDWNRSREDSPAWSKIRESPDMAMLKRNAPMPALIEAQANNPVGSLITSSASVANSAVAELSNVIDYLMKAHRLQAFIQPVRHRLPTPKGIKGVDKRTERSGAPLLCCNFCHLPPQRYQSLHESSCTVRRPGIDPLKLFFLNWRTTDKMNDDPTARLSDEYCNVHAGSSKEAGTLRRGGQRHLEDIEHELKTFRPLAPMSLRDRRMVCVFRAIPKVKDNEVPRIRASLKQFRPLINDFVRYYAAAMPIPPEVLNGIFVSDRFAGLVITSDGGLYTMDCDSERIVSYEVTENERSAWEASFSGLKTLRTYLDDGLEYGDDVWISCADPRTTHLRVPLASVRLYHRQLCRGRDGKFRITPNAGKALEITTLSTDWLRAATTS